MGALMRSYDWKNSPLGPPDDWPQSLRTAVRILLTTQHPMFIFWGPELIQFYNDAYRQTLGPERHPRALGQRGRDCWDEIWDIIGPQIDLVMSGKGATWHEDQLIPLTRHGRREDVWWTYSYGPIDDATAENGVGGVLVVCNDVTERHRALAALERSEERLERALSAGVVGIWEWDMETDTVFADERFAQLYGVDLGDPEVGTRSKTFFKVIHPKDRERVQRHIERAMTSGESFFDEYRLVQADGSIRWVVVRGRCYYDEARQPTRFSGSAIDITERKESEEQRKLLMKELNHRVKNTLAIVSAIANQTFRDAVPSAEGRKLFLERIGALSAAQDVLIGERREAAEIRTLVNNAITPHAGNPDRFRVDGPSVRILSNAAVPVTLALHELATNAAKYGALSKSNGRVEVAWTIENGADDRTRLRFVWRENGGPPVQPPKKIGFGSRLIKSALTAQLAASVDMDFRENGMICTIDVPMENISGQSMPRGRD